MPGRNDNRRTRIMPIGRRKQRSGARVDHFSPEPWSEELSGPYGARRASRTGDHPDPLGASEEDWENQGWFLELERQLLLNSRDERGPCPWEHGRARVKDGAAMPVGSGEKSLGAGYDSESGT